MTPVIAVDHVSKYYRLGTLGGASFRDDFARWWARVRGKPDPFRRVGENERTRSSEGIWALEDVSFQVEQGEVLGIIGRNGAGKSTLLKILSRVTSPTRGEVRIRGRIASLLEVGTGFHPELTGRENVFLNGAILGMRKAEIVRKLDEIVAFAEIDQFLDTPVKRYSSGMYVRLAFAVAAHLEPEILIVDEVLAVGDAAFQQKCLGKMGDVAKGGRTVLFVSHNMAAVTRLCQTGVLLGQGRVEAHGNVFEVAARYQKSHLQSMAIRQWDELASAPGDATVRLVSVRVTSRGEVSETIDIREPVVVEMEYLNREPGAKLIPSFSFFNDQGTFLFIAADFGALDVQSAGRYLARTVIPGNLLSEGMVKVAAEVSTRHPVYQVHVLEYDAVGFNVVDTGEPGSVRSGWGRPLGGAVRPKLPFEHTPIG